MDPYSEIEDFYFALHDNTVGGWWVLSIVYCQDGVESCIEICRVRRCKKRDQGVLKSYKNKLNWTQIYKDKFIAFIVSVLPHNANKTCKCTLNEVLELFLWIIYQNCAAGEWSSQVILHDLLENILGFCWKYLVSWSLQYLLFQRYDVEYKSFIYHVLKTPEYMINFDSILIILWILKIIHLCQPFWVCLLPRFILGL